MHKYRINLITMADVVEFVKLVSVEKGIVKLIDDTGFCVSGKSFLGAVAAVEWDTLYCVSENDIYSKIQKFCV